MDSYYLLIAGSRSFNNYDIAKKCLDKEIGELPIIVISGTAKGADSMGEQWANEHNFEIKRYKPEWDTLGRKAGILRNIEMYNFIKEKEFAKIIIFWDGQSRGAMHMIKTAANGKIPYQVYDFNGNLL
jgi:hypothetical protein